MSRRYQGKRKLQQIWVVAMAVCVCIIVIGGGFLGIRALLGREGGDPAQTEPDARPTPGVEETLPPELTEAERVRAMTFVDVNQGTPHHDAVSYAVSKGYFPDTVGSAFDPDRLVTNNELSLAMGVVTGEDYALVVEDAGKLTDRQILAGFLVVAATELELDMTRVVSLESYPDAYLLAPEIREGMAWVLEAGLFDGIVTNKLHPELAVSRAQLAQSLLALDALRPEGDGELARELLGERAPSVAVTVSHETLLDLQAAVDASVKRNRAVGAQAAIIKGGDVVATLNSGWATKDVDDMSDENKMRIASISKVVVGMGTMALVEDGTVQLDAPVGQYWDATFENPMYPKDTVTIRNILNHTSSIWPAGDTVSRAYADVKGLLSTNKGYTNGRPGDISSWYYNNYAFSVLGMTLELAVGKNMDTIMDEKFFDALGIDAAFEMGEVDTPETIVTLYREDATPWRTAAEQRTILLSDPAPGANGKYFAGGFTINASDMGKLVAILANDGTYQGLRFLSPQSVELMETRSTELVAEGEYYQGFPLDYRDNMYGREGIYYHNGNAYGAFTCASYDPLTGDGVVVLATGSGPAKIDGVYAVCSDINAAVYPAIK